MQTRVAGVVLFAVVLIAAPFADWQHYAFSRGSDTSSLLYGFGNITLHKGAITQLAKPAAKPVPSANATQEAAGLELQDMPAEFAWGKTAASEEAPAAPGPAEASADAAAAVQAGTPALPTTAPELAKAPATAGEEAPQAEVQAPAVPAPAPGPAEAPDTVATEAAANPPAAEVQEAPAVPAPAPGPPEVPAAVAVEAAAAPPAAEVQASAVVEMPPGPAEVLDAVATETAATALAAEVQEAPAMLETPPGPAKAPNAAVSETAAAPPVAEVQAPAVLETPPGSAEALDAVASETAATPPVAEVQAPAVPAMAPGLAEAPDAASAEFTAVLPSAEEAPEVPETPPAPAEETGAVAAAELQAAAVPPEVPDAAAGEAAAAPVAEEVQEAPAVPATEPGPAEVSEAAPGEVAAAPAAEVQAPNAVAGEAAAAAPAAEVQDMPADFAWGKTPPDEAPAEQDAPETSEDELKITGRWDRFLEEKWQNDSSRTRFRLLDSRGPWPGQLRFATALFQDLPESLVRSKDCDVVVNTGWRPTSWLLKRMGLDRPSDVPRVWLLINQEPLSMKEFWSLMPKNVVKTAVMVGNWWNETHAEKADDKTSSIWLPFGSSYFADLPQSTPLDLQHRKLSRDVGVRGEELRRLWQRRLGRRRSTVVYQQHTCATNMRLREVHPPWENYREKFWDVLNQRMKEDTQDYGYAVGRCNGNLSLGYANLPGIRVKPHPNLTFGNMLNLYRFQEGLAKYSWFRFVVALENSINMSGYISEKPVQALLAGAVPIFAGAAEAPQMLNERSYVPLTPGVTENETAKVVTEALLDEDKYAQLWQEDAASDEQLRRFFSWHPAVWPSHGDSLRRRIVKELDRLCQ